MAPSVTRQERYLAAFEFAQNERVRRITKWRLDCLFVNIRKSRHGIEPAAADNSNLRLRQSSFLFLEPRAAHKNNVADNSSV